MDASLITQLGAGVAFGLLIGTLFHGSLWFGVVLMVGGAPLSALALQLARFVLLTFILYAAVRFGAPALVAAASACVASRWAAQGLVHCAPSET
jgi:hypothetical protein